MPLARFDRLAPERRQRLIAAAAREFSAEGFEGASLGRIAREAGVSKPLLYYYFDHKGDLYATIVREAWRQLRPEGMFAIDRLDSGSFWPALEALHSTGFERGSHEPWLISVWKLAYHPPPAGSADTAVADVFAEAQALLRQLLRKGQTLGLVRDDLPDGLLIALFTGADNAADHWLVDQYEDLGPEAVLRLSRHVFETLRLLLTPPGQRS